MIDIMFVVKTFIIQLRFFNVFNQNPSKFKGLNPSFLNYWKKEKKKKKLKYHKRVYRCERQYLSWYY